MMISVPDGLVAQQTPADTLPLVVVDTNPLTGQELGPQEAITVFFDRALNCDTASGAVSLEPAIEGMVSCDGASLTFTPAAPYPTGTALALTVATSLQAADGGALERWKKHSRST
jgi:hypothetical protein